MAAGRSNAGLPRTTRRRQQAVLTTFSVSTDLRHLGKVAEILRR